MHVRPVLPVRLLLVSTLLGCLCSLRPCVAQEKGIPDNDASGNPEDVVMMEKMLVQGRAKFKWRYAKSEHFEIICHTKDTAWLPQVIQKTELIIRLLADRCPLYRFNSDLPIKIIFIDAQGLDRFDGETKNLTKTDRSTRGIAGRVLTSGWTSSTGRDKEQLILLIRMRRDLSVGKIVHYTSTLLNRYIQQEFRIYDIDYRKLNVPIMPLLHTPRMRDYDQLDRPKVELEGRYAFRKTRNDVAEITSGFSRDASSYSAYYEEQANLNGFDWHGPEGFAVHNFRIQKDKVYFRRYSVASALDALLWAPDYKTSSRKPSERQLLKQYFNAPYLSLKEVLEVRLPRLANLPRESSAKVRAEYMVHVRELIDFSCYCIFGPNPKHGEVYAKLALASRKGPTNETIFKKLFGVGYDQFHNEMYSYYRNLAKTKDPVYKGSAWGTPNMLVATLTAKNLPKLVEFQEADRAQTARIIAEWFELNKRPDIARRTLLAAETETPWVMRNPEFLAAFGLSEARHGDRTKALALLEKAADMEVVRPEAYRTLSKLLLENILKTNGADYKLDQAEFNDVLKPLLVAMKQPQPNQDTYQQIIDLIGRTQGKPSKELLETISRDCAAFFPDDFDLLEQMLPLLVQNGLQPSVKALLSAAGNSVLSADESTRLEQLISSVH